jgi:hypothetical protein
MYCVSRHFATAAVTAICAVAATAAHADDEASVNRYVVTNLASDVKGPANFQDPVLQNSWGVAFTPAGSPFWRHRVLDALRRYRCKARAPSFDPSAGWDRAPYRLPTC